MAPKPSSMHMKMVCMVLRKASARSGSLCGTAGDVHAENCRAPELWGNTCNVLTSSHNESARTHRPQVQIIKSGMGRSRRP
eukprot:4413118-Heterocapsa_arctica.AAC.1